MEKALRLLFITIFSLALCNDLYATHLLGADLQYECLGPGQYRVTMTLYRDCNGVSPSSSQNLSYSSADCGVSGSIQLSLQGSPQDITPLCPSVPSACGGSGNYGIQEWTYTGILNLPPGCGDDWILGWSQCCRNNAINTLSSPGGQNMYVNALLDNTLAPVCNSSPTFNNGPGSIVCVNQPVVYNHGVSDINGDSLYFSLGTCYQANGSSVNYSGGFNGPNPLTTSTGVSINPNTGALSFTPSSQQVGVLCVNVKEYRNGVLIGEINRDMQFTVIACSNVPPQASGVNGAPNTSPVNFEASICANGDLCFTIDGSDPNGNNVTMSWNAEIPGGTFVVTNNGTPNPTAEFCWNPGQIDIGPNIFTVNVQDDACPIIGQGTYTYVVNVLPSPNTLSAGPLDTVCFGESTTLTATSAPAALSYTWSPAASLSSSTGSTVTASPLSSAIYEVSAVFPDGCNLTSQTAVLVTANPSLGITPTNSFNCSGQANDLTANGSSNFGPLSYTWMPGSLTGPNVTVSPNVTTTYSVTAVDALGCSTTSSTTITIAAPTGNVCNVLYVTPTGSPSGNGSKADPMDLITALEEGACNGTVVKMAVGDYVTDTVINRVTSYITLEGGFNPAINWDKVSNAGATRILRTATQSYSLVSNSIVVGSGILNETGPNPEVVAIRVSNQTGFRFQDITVETELISLGGTMAGYEGVDVVGVRLNTCDNYNIVRTQILTSDAGRGAQQIWSIGPTNGGDATALDVNTNGAGGNIINSFLSAGASGNGGGGSPAGISGVSNDLTLSGSALATNDNNFNLAAQAVIQMEDIACTETLMDFNQAASGTWTFDSGSAPPNATGSTVTTQYSNLGRKDITYGANQYTGFANIILDAQIIPNFTTSAPFIDGQYRICEGEEVDFVATNGGVGYLYHWDMGGGSNPNNYDGPNLGNLDNVDFPNSGIYTIELQFETNCCGLSIPYSIELYVEENPVVSTNPISADVCNGSSTPVTIVVEDSINNGIISWSPSAGLDNPNSFTVQALPGDTTAYTVTVTDSTGLCSDVTAVQINVVNLETNTSAVNATCGPNGSATVFASGGSGSYSYLWDDPANQTTATATNLAVGNYNVIVTDNNIGCTDSAFVVVNPAAGSLVGFVSNVLPVSCNGNSDGIATVSIIGGIAPFDYVWSPTGGTTLNTTATSDTTSWLPGGTYDVLITDDAGCTYTVSAFIPEPDSLIIAEDSLYNPTCIGATDGYISITVDQGVGPYSIVWDDVSNQTGYVLDSLGIGTYCATVTDASGCVDSLCFTLTAPLLTDSIFDTICQFESYLLPGGQWVSPMMDTSSIDSFVNAIGCDSVVSTFLTVYPVYDANIDTTLCAGQSFTAPNGFSFIPSQDTSFTDSLLTINNCDSLFFVNVTVQQLSVDSIDTTLCQGQTLTVNGQVYSNSGSYLDTALYSNTGCDSVQYVINLNIDSFVVQNLSTTLCQGDSFVVNGISYVSSGLYYDTLNYAASGCDSVQFIIDVQVDSLLIENYDTTLCQGDFLLVNGVSYNSTGLYYDTLGYAASGCDSVQFVIDLQIDSVELENIDTTLCEGQSLVVNGVSYNSTGIYYDTLAHVLSGCDSIQFVIDVQVDSLTIENIDTTLCEGQSLVVNGVSYNSTGIYFDTLTHVISGCDSVQFIIDVQIDSVTPVFVDTVICQGDTIQVNGVDYFSSGLYSDTSFHTPSNCINELFTINLTVAPLPSVIANSSEADSAACVNNTISVFGSGSPGVSYIWNNGVSDNIAFTPVLGETVYQVTGTDALGCVNVDSITITGTPTYSSTVNVSICEDENYFLPDGTSVNTAGTYPVTLNSAFNCDSTIITVLDVNFLGSFTALEDIIVCDGLAQTITISSNNMTSFEWFVNDGTGNQSLIGNPDYLGASSSELSFNLDTNLHLNTYTVQMIDECGNAYSETLNLEVYSPHPVENPIPDTTFCLHELDVVTVDYNGRDYTWSNGSFGPSILVDESGEYIVNFTENGTNCALSDTIQIDLEDCISNCVVLAPTGFSPNSSGANDIFRVVTTCDEGFSFFQFTVYNRWGEVVFSTDDWRSGWDGSYQGRTAEIGTYTYYVEYTKELTNKKESITGNVTLIR